MATSDETREPLPTGSEIGTIHPIQAVTDTEAVSTEKSKPPLESLSELQESIRKAESELGREGRVLIRYSGTQSMCRVMVEGPTEEITDRLTESLAGIVRKNIGG